MAEQAPVWEWGAPSNLGPTPDPELSTGFRHSGRVPIAPSPDSPKEIGPRPGRRILSGPNVPWSVFPIGTGPAWASPVRIVPKVTDPIRIAPDPVAPTWTDPGPIDPCNGLPWDKFREPQSLCRRSCPPIVPRWEIARTAVPSGQASFSAPNGPAGPPQAGAPAARSM